ncbi:alpha/beta hydrolase [Nocardia sp. NBC_01503]|uniref:alpha/beta fold hydrolase n=1 Tax=Nocardia sp. NBC_01503 TaxID=2975997 RepID=UPI002E7AD54C|nr:alpha/beta hydrolase [Nocardia sp. NBC_01503]WTL29706.1 alpha/beta hydrolase [Nocardia sp. NBC_01503]
MPFVSSAGAKVHFTDSGGDGPAVVFSHGFFLDQEMFAGQVAGLGAEYRVISVDARGHGLTEDSGGAFTYWDLARDVWAVLDSLGIDEVVAGGMSQGGYTAMRMALQQPERVRGLILIATSAEPYSAQEQARYRGIMKAWMGMTPFEPMAEITAKTMIGGTEADQRAWITKWCNDDRTRVRLAADCLIGRESVAEAIGELECPAILIRGEHDQAESHDDMSSLARQFRSATEFYTVANATHAVNITHADEVNAHLRQFLVGLG